MVTENAYQTFSRTPTNYLSVQEPLPRIVAVKLTTTNSTTIFTASSGKNAIESVLQLRIANTSASVQTVTVHWYDSSTTTDFAIYSGKSIAANDTLIDENLRFKFDDGDAIKCTAGAINVLEVILLVTERGRSF